MMILVWTEGDIIGRTQNHHINMRNRALVQEGDDTFKPREKPVKKVKPNKKNVIPLGLEKQVRRR